MKRLFLTVFLFAAAISGFAADKLAVAEPTPAGAVSKDEIAAFWGMLEANAGGGKYELITRSALQSMLTEIGLTESSDLVKLTPEQKAKAGELKTVRYILVSKLGKAGQRFTLTLMVLNASTGEIVPGQRISSTTASMEETAEKLKSILRKIGIGPDAKFYGRSAVLAPIIKTGSPEYLSDELSVALEGALQEKGVRLQLMKKTEPILRKYGIVNLAETEPAMFDKVGDALEVDYLIQVFVTRFSIRSQKKQIEVSRREAVRHLGDINGNIHVVSAQTGELIRTLPFKAKVDFDNLDDDTTDWETEDFGRYLIQAALPSICKQVTDLFTVKK